MILARVFLVGSAAFALGACVGPDGQMMPMGGFEGGAPQGGYPPPAGGYPQGSYPQQQGGYPAPNGYPQSAPGGYPPMQGQQAGGYYPAAGQQQPYGGPQMQAATPPPTSDYPPHLRDEYRTAYDIGARDRSLGYLSDYKRGYTRFGHGFESYFQEGYNDGFNGARMRH